MSYVHAPPSVALNRSAIQRARDITARPEVRDFLYSKSYALNVTIGPPFEHHLLEDICHDAHS